MITTSKIIPWNTEKFNGTAKDIKALSWNKSSTNWKIKVKIAKKHEINCTGQRSSVGRLSKSRRYK